MIANMTPEQVLAARARFELAFRESGEIDFSIPGADSIFALSANGFSYADANVDAKWGWFLQGTSALHTAFMQVPSNAQLLSDADELRRIRQYSSCFTKAYDKRETVFVLRAQDEAAPKVLAQWLYHYQTILGESNVKFISAKATLGVFLSHPNRKKAD